MTDLDPMPFGKYRGVRLEDVPARYLLWLWNQGLKCGVEDRDCQDRYQGAEYGYAQGSEQMLEWAVNEARAALALAQPLQPTKDTP